MSLDLERTHWQLILLFHSQILQKELGAPPPDCKPPPWLVSSQGNGTEDIVGM